MQIIKIENFYKEPKFWKSLSINVNGRICEIFDF